MKSAIAVVLVAAVARAAPAPAACPAGRIVFVDRPVYPERVVHRWEPCLRAAPPAPPLELGDPAIDAARREDDRRALRRWAVTSWAQCQVSR